MLLHLKILFFFSFIKYGKFKATSSFLYFFFLIAWLNGKCPLVFQNGQFMLFWDYVLPVYVTSVPDKQGVSGQKLDRVSSMTWQINRKFIRI